MNIVILGAGEIGSYLAAVLAEEQHSVTLIDKDPTILEKVSQKTDVATLLGYGSRWKLLDTLIESEPDIFIAMTGDDETNLVSCSIAKNLGYPKTVARVKEIGFLARSRLDFGRLFYVDHFIGAEVLAANDILKSIINPEDLAIENFAHGAIQMRTIVVSDKWKQTDIRLSDLKLPEEMIIGLIRRKKIDPKNPDKIIEKVIFPHGNDHIEVGDEITVLGETKFMQDIHAFFKIEQKKPKSVVIVGASTVGVRLAHILEMRNIYVKIIEHDINRCKEIADLLPKSTVINEDGKNLDFLASEQIQDVDAFVACTNRDEENFLISSIGKHIGCKKVISLISNTSFASILKANDIKFSVSERVNIANRISSIIHEEKIISIATLCDNKAKVLEIKVSENCELVGIPLSELSAKLPEKLIIAAIENRGRIMIGKGNRIISPGDTLIINTSPEILAELQVLF
ncbi:MAG: Trk system potassium uptake protein TrkA [Candidatus Anoxychlamydiales bacterium]|nr:Trk system potassium uptake protein TrkA [Candidatus Anoxychlamydiales bacterium]NGX36515.1 Trk system potassium uptake protein TrkA [Candidatus Anoxychlamydiales bacterium]